MGKGGKHLQSAKLEIKELQECNHELHNKIEVLEWNLKQKQNIINQMTNTLEATKDLQNELHMKEQLIDALKTKLRKKQDLLDVRRLENIDAVCDTEDLIQTANVICETNDLI